jgi:hypothetical protein
MLNLALIIGGVLLGGIVLFLLWDWYRERRDLSKHLARIAERKEAFERFKQKKRNSQEITKPKPGPAPKPKGR